MQRQTHAHTHRLGSTDAAPDAHASYAVDAPPCKFVALKTTENEQQCTHIANAPVFVFHSHNAPIVAHTTPSAVNGAYTYQKCNSREQLLRAQRPTARQAVRINANMTTADTEASKKKGGQSPAM